MKLTVVIPAYNEEKYLGKTLDSIHNLNTKDHELEIIVVDGGSTDRTGEVARNHGAKVIKVAHRGIGFARQQGLAHATGEIVLYTDADTIVSKDWVIRHINTLFKPNVSCSCGTFRVTDGKFPYFQQVNYIQPMMLWALHRVFYIPIACGQNIAFWKEKALEIGGFDESLSIMEDIDFAIRMRKTGKVIFDLDNIVYSSGRRSNEGFGFYTRMTKVLLKYFIHGKANLGSFPDFR